MSKNKNTSKIDKSDEPHLEDAEILTVEGESTVQQDEKSIDDTPIGYLMRGERLTMGLELSDIQEKLKIRSDIVDAIENNDLESIGRPQFVSGYIRSYAQLLKMDPEYVLNAYEHQCGLQRQKPQSSATMRSASNSGFMLNKPKRVWSDRIQDVTRTTSLAFPLLIVFFLLGGVVYASANFVRGLQSLEVVPTQSRPTALTENEMPQIAQDELTPDQQISGINYDELYQRQALQIPAVTPRAGRIADVDVNRVGVFASETPAIDNDNLEAGLADPTETAAVSAIEPSTPTEFVAEAGPVVTVGPTIPQIELMPLGESWVRLTNEDGDVIYEKLLNPGEVVNVPIDGYVPVLRKAGNASELYVRVNGDIFGPVGQDGASVVDNVPLTPEAVNTSYEKISPELIEQLKEKEQSYLAKAEN